MIIPVEFSSQKEEPFELMGLRWLSPVPGIALRTPRELKSRWHESFHHVKKWRHTEKKFIYLFKIFKKTLKTGSEIQI